MNNTGILRLATHVVRGEQVQAEAMIQKNPGLLLEKCQVVDYSGRRSEGTPLQLALGAEDVKFHEDEECMAEILKDGDFLSQSLSFKYSASVVFYPLDTDLSFRLGVDYCCGTWGWMRSALGAACVACFTTLRQTKNNRISRACVKSIVQFAWHSDKKSVWNS